MLIYQRVANGQQLSAIHQDLVVQVQRLLGGKLKQNMFSVDWSESNWIQFFFENSANWNQLNSHVHFSIC